jgi:putative membrane protein
VNAFETPSKTDIQDPGTYDKLTNLTTDKKLEQSDGKVDLTTVAGEPFYYQGNLGKDTKLPWKVQITYRLDGKVVKPSELAGKDGKLDIELKVDGLDDDSATADFAKSFLLQAQGTFPNQNFKLDQASNATIATSGSNTVLTYVLIPGQNGDWHVTGDAHDFTYGGWQIAAMPLDLDLDASKIDTSELTSATAKLQDGVGQLDAGGARLRDALGLLSNGAGQAATGAGTLATGADQLAAGTREAKAGTGRLAAGAGTLASGSASLSNGNAKLAVGARQLSQGAGALRDTLRSQSGTFDRLDSGAKQVSNGTQQLYQALSTHPAPAAPYRQPGPQPDAPDARRHPAEARDHQVAGRHHVLRGSGRHQPGGGREGRPHRDRAGHGRPHDRAAAGGHVRRHRAGRGLRLQAGGGRRKAGGGRSRSERRLRKPAA